MAKQLIDIGAVANDGTGDPLRTAFDKTNDNFDELYVTNAEWNAAGSLPAIRPSLLLDFANSQTVDPRVIFTRASTATYFDRSGVMQTAAANVPRIDFDPVTGECKGLLIEEIRTNLVFPSAIGESQIRTVAAVAHTLSFWGTGSVALSGVATGTLVGTGVSDRVTLTFTPTAGSLTLGVTGSITNIQLEAGSSATTLIPTTSAAITRSADVASMTGANFSEWYRQDEFAIVLNFMKPATTSDAVRRLISISDGTGTHRLTVNTSTIRQVAIFSANGASSLAPQDAYTDDQPAAFAMAIASGDFRICLDGGEVATAAHLLPAATLTTLRIGSLHNGDLQPNGYISRLAYYPARLTNAQFQALSS